MTGDGDDEVVAVDLSAVAADVERIVFVVSIDQAEDPPAELRPGALRLLPRRQPGNRRRSGPLRPQRRCRAGDLHDLLASCTGTTASGSSRPSARATPPASPALPRTSASSSAKTPRPQKERRNNEHATHAAGYRGLDAAGPEGAGRTEEIVKEDDAPGMVPVPAERQQEINAQARAFIAKSRR